MLKSIRHLDYVILLCNDLSLMKDFYHGVMEFPIYRENPSMDDWVEISIKKQGDVLQRYPE